MKFNIFTLFAAGILSLATLSCKKESVTPNEADPNNAKFSVALYAAENGNAEVYVSHDGSEALTWYGFLTEDVTTDLSALVADKAAKVTKDQIKAGTFYKDVISGIKSGVDYRYVAFGISLDGETYGIPGEARVVSALTFVLTAKGHTSESVSVKIEHNGSENNTWYGFLTEDLEADASVLVKENLPAEAAFKTGVKDSIVFEGLKPATSYRYIVTGITSKGVFGEPAEIVLSTQKYVSSEKYSVNYIGFFEYEDFGPVPGIEVTAAEDASKYYYYAEAADIAGEYDEFDDYIEHIISEATSALLEDAEYYEAPVSEFLISGSQTIPLLLYNGSYRIFVLSLDDNGKFTGDISWTEADVVEPGSDLKVNPDWHLSYLEEAAAGDPTKYKVYIINESEDASAEKGYYLDFQPKSVIDEAGGLDAYINGYLDTYRMLFQIYQMFGVDPLYYGTDYKSFSADAGEKYVGFIVGFTPLYYLSGDYAYVEFTVGENPVNAPALPVKAARDVKRNEIEQAFLAHKIEARKSARRLLK